METPEKNIPESIYWCHQHAIETLEFLASLVGQCDPKMVWSMKNIGGRYYQKRDCGNIGKAIAYFRNEYLEWSEYRDVIPCFSSVCNSPIKLLFIIEPSAHAVLDQLARTVLNRIWGRIFPRRPEEGIKKTPEENLWPVTTSEMLKEADLDQMADAVRIYTKDREADGPLDMDCIEWLSAAIQQEYARLIQTLPNSEEQPASTAAPQTPVAIGKNSGKLKTNDLMILTLEKTPEAANWSISQWETNIKRSRAAIHATQQWERLAAVHKVAKVERALQQDRLRGMNKRGMDGGKIDRRHQGQNID
ncbi:MAG: hypothetical protein WCJ35_12745 [Planctomycetota bacterium]